MKKFKEFLKDSWPFLILFLIGFLITIYPLISQIYYRVDSQKDILTFVKQAEKLAELREKRSISDTEKHYETAIQMIFEELLSD